MATLLIFVAPYLCRCKRGRVKKELGYRFHMTTTSLWTLNSMFAGISKPCHSLLLLVTFCNMLVRLCFDCWQNRTQEDVWRCHLFRGPLNHHYPPKLFPSSSARIYCKGTVVDVLLSVEKRLLAITEVRHRITSEFQPTLHGTLQNSTDTSMHWPEGCSGWACRKETASALLWAIIGV